MKSLLVSKRKRKEDELVNRQQFQAASHAFVAWAGKLHCNEDGHLAPVGPGSLATTSIDLAISKSSKVPVAVRQKVPFFRLTQVYSWRATGMTSGSFAETRAKLENLSNGIIMARNDAEALAACEDIVRWGGDRNSNVGALPFLRSQASLLRYLNAVKSDLALQTAVAQPAGELPAILAMNSMLTKVHALNSGDGLPIYDSRVAGAIATLVETWRCEDGQTAEPLSAALVFPAVGGGGQRRSVHARYPGSIKPPTLHYSSEKQSKERAIRTAKEWASAKVRLGWLLSELLTNPSPSGIRSLEACLFMAGYDCAGINRQP